ncbi:hypothetical protein AA0313_2337 [Acetobacter indonesiensis NRIC 0313]|uniref:Lytic transglycosylase n=1 Tax=Acetobacter indonesiensis TaxID=104101 RepID=A0A252ALH6_9PROT|nr:hypothetical protein [Acetobacter indonesiensis]OUI90485.1 hypothetical protein HK17_13860 [Acetobacter indonesiensis]GAN62586.1 lytic transglycosylase [Acetobacter indonesiensis]GBQ60269.1 hypothetical protein AA0313_2337 [Acetobacter indonesiensis NRIC 0313]GEN04897.1 hypothetical protein AIN02nite_29220 [Acetobacter indonesiensis]
MGDGVAAAADTAGDAFHSLERKALAFNDEHPTTFRGNARGLGQRLTPDMKAKQAFLGRLEKQYGLPNGLLDGMWAQESSRGLNAVPSKAGVLGDFQIMPDVGCGCRG